jgi:hypothetical protein
MAQYSDAESQSLICGVHQRFNKENMEMVTGTVVPTYNIGVGSCKPFYSTLYRYVAEKHYNILTQLGYKRVFIDEVPSAAVAELRREFITT